MPVFRSRILISRDLLRFYFNHRFLLSFKKIYQTSKSVFNDITKRLEVCQKYSATRPTFSSLLSVWKCGQACSFVFDIFHHIVSLYLTKSCRLVYRTLSTSDYQLLPIYHFKNGCPKSTHNASLRWERFVTLHVKTAATKYFQSWIALSIYTS